MEKLVNSFAEYLAIELSLNKDKKDVVAYGMFTLLQTILSILLVLLLGIIFKCAVESLIISSTTSILRKYSGGVHASTPERCIILGAILCLSKTLIVVHLIYPSTRLELLVTLGILTFIYSYYTVIKLAPVDSSKKPIRTIKKRKRMKKYSIATLNMYGIISLVLGLIYMYTGDRKLVIYILCIYIGIAWQVFTLTNKGELIFSKIDKIINKVLESRRK